MKESFFPFTILSDDAQRQSGDEGHSVLINVHHIVSIKPINIMTETKLISGFWIRTSNGKKYRAVSIPKELEALFQSSSQSVSAKTSKTRSSENKINPHH
ncbi:MAG: hypothetical protein OXB88_04090 [Bacteriovoracales bacterium]|nr:hypothetical protein [Bacteriovoracales bacterium]